MAFGMHLTIDGYDCDPKVLSRISEVTQFLEEISDEINMTRISEPQVLEYRPPSGKPQNDWGVSGMVMIAESHIAIHTFPEQRYFSLDIFSCKPFDIRQANNKAIGYFRTGRIEVNVLHRGLKYRRTPGEKPGREINLEGEQ
jgi:S-adenosylmethionine decarboxylase